MITDNYFDNKVWPQLMISLFVWSALIAVTLLVLSIGYYCGGLLADGQTHLRLSHIIFLAALFIALIPPASSNVLSATDTLGLRMGTLASAIILFAIPLTLLGTRLILSAVSLSLLVLALSLASYERIRLRVKVSTGLWMTTTVMSCLTIGIGSQLGGHYSGKEYKVLSEEESHYGWVRVVDQPTEGVRWLLSDASTIGATSLDTGNGLLSYQQIVSQAPRF